MTGFDGFGETALLFYEGLEADNSRTYWHDHAGMYTDAVATPLRRLADELEPRFGPCTIFRPYRDLRFTADKRPYKESASLAIRTGSGAEEDGSSGGALYLELSTAGLLLAGGYYQPARDQLVRFRELQDDAARAASLDAVLAEIEATGFRFDDGDRLKTAPRGWSRDHPRIDMFRRTRLAVSTTLEPGDWLSSGECLDRVVEGWTTAGRWNAWLEEHVGPPESSGR